MDYSKKGIGAHQLHRTYKMVWFMAHRIRKAMTVMGMEPSGGEGDLSKLMRRSLAAWRAEEARLSP